MRILSFLIAWSVAAFVIIYPRAIASDMTSVPHGWLVLLLLGMSFCFVYGVGFKAKNRFLAFLFSPLVAWTCVGVASFMIFSGTRNLTVSVLKSLLVRRPRGFLCV